MFRHNCTFDHSWPAVGALEPDDFEHFDPIQMSFYEHGDCRVELEAETRFRLMLDAGTEASRFLRHLHVVPRDSAQQRID